CRAGTAGRGAAGRPRASGRRSTAAPGRAAPAAGRRTPSRAPAPPRPGRASPRRCARRGATKPALARPSRVLLAGQPTADLQVDVVVQPERRDSGAIMHPPTASAVVERVRTVLAQARSRAATLAFIG